MSSSVSLRQMASALLHLNFMKGFSNYKGIGKIVCTVGSLKSVLLTCTALSGVIKKTSPLLLEFMYVINSSMFPCLVLYGLLRKDLNWNPFRN